MWTASAPSPTAWFHRTETARKQRMWSRRGSTREGGALVTGVIDCHGLTERGGRRNVKEGQFLIADLTKSGRVEQSSLGLADHGQLLGSTRAKLLAVADGKGAEGAGAVASCAALSAAVGYVLDVLPWFFRLDPRYEDDLRDDLQAVLEKCQVHVRQAATGGPGMGTSLTMACLLWPRAYVVHAGDSRCYLLRPPVLRRVTTDQTFAQRLADHSVMTPEEAEASSWQDVLWSAVGAGADLTPEVHSVNLRAGDVLLLCSSGLARHVPEPVIAATLRATDSAREACEWLVALANEGGATDNATAVAARFG